jgi:glucose dehydrogenase
MKQKFHTFTAAPLFTSAEPEQIKMLKYKAGDTVYLDCSGDKYIITVSSYNENEDSVRASSFKFKMRGDKVWTQDGSAFFYLDSRFGDTRTIHPSLESLEGLRPVKIGDTLYLTLNETQFIVNVNKIDGGNVWGEYRAKKIDGDSQYFSDGVFVIKHYKRYASQQEMEQAAKNA